MLESQQILQLFLTRVPSPPRLSPGVPHPEELLLPPSHPLSPAVQRRAPAEEDLGRGPAVRSSCGAGSKGKDVL